MQRRGVRRTRPTPRPHKCVQHRGTCIQCVQHGEKRVEDGSGRPTCVSINGGRVLDPGRGGGACGVRRAAQRQTDRQTDRQTETERERKKEREGGTERGGGAEPGVRQGACGVRPSGACFAPLSLALSLSRALSLALSRSRSLALSLSLHTRDVANRACGGGACGVRPSRARFAPRAVLDPIPKHETSTHMFLHMCFKMR